VRGWGTVPLVRKIPFTPLEESFEIFTLALIEVMDEVAWRGVCFCDESEEEDGEDSHGGYECAGPHPGTP